MVIDSTIVTGGTFTVGFDSGQNIGMNFSSDNNVGAEMGIVNGTTNNYNDIANKPSINGVILQGNLTTQDLKIAEDKTYIHYQRVAANEWSVQHNLDKFPSVTVVDSGDNVVIGNVTYIDENKLTIKFTASFSGKAFCN